MSQPDSSKLETAVFRAVIVVAIVLSIFFWYRYSENVYVHEGVIADPAMCPGDVTFAVIGDYGTAKKPEADVAALVKSWQPDFIVTVGDNNYPDGEAETIDANIGQYYSDYIFPYVGEYGSTATENRFWPALGNHDLRTELGQPYLDYFTLPGNERTYDFVAGPVHFFVLNSDPTEPNGRSADSVQGQWLQAGLAESDALWKLVVMHHTPYTSSMKRNPDKELQWPYADWGATAVLYGHDHLYERFEADGIPYFVNGAGGKELYNFGRPEPESVVRYNQDHGAMLVQASQACLNFTFYNRNAELIDSVTVTQ
ncbi:MAG: metallophosphoesterase [Anaerolineae bacterium]|nr:metallophosphoesterase [Anaerolineae bacterium]